jgi:twitching motility protein PilT
MSAVASGAAAESICSLLDRAREQQASDVHIDPAEGSAFRIFSKIERVRGTSLSAAATEAFVTHSFDVLSRARLEKLGMADAIYTDSRLGGLRIHASRSRQGLRLAIRLLPSTLPDLDSLLLPEPVARFSRARSGLVIVAGPRANGKTTTAVALLDRLGTTFAHHVVTIQCSIEHTMRWQHSIASQYEVGRDIASFAQGIRGAMRADADVVFVDEILDLDSLEASLDAAQGGHLVLAALAAPPEATAVLSRLIALFPADELERARRRLGDVLRGIIGLRLVPARDGISMRAAVELLFANESMRRLIREGALHQVRSQIAQHAREGLQTLEASLSRLVADGAVDIDVARAASQYPDEIEVGSLAALRR